MNIITKTYESLLPFLVVDAISTQGANFNSTSVRLIDQGWAWLVSGRKLLVWKFKDTKSPANRKTRRILSPCFELNLPQSDLAHRADLVNVFFMPQNPNTSMRAVTVPAALAVSPEGTVRFWSSIASERYTESQVQDSQGLEFCTLSTLSALEYICGTTSGSVYVLAIDIAAHDSKSVLSFIPLTSTSGILSGFSRRMTTLFFGPLATDVGSDSRRPLIAVPKYSQSTIEKTGSVDRPFFVMSSSFKLRQWSRSNNGPNSTNQIVREWDLHRSVLTKLMSGLGLTETDTLNFWPIDMITTKTKDLLILIVTLNASRENAISYATCIFNPYRADDNITSLTILRSHTWHYSNESEDQLLALRFLERRASSSLCFMYDKRFLFLASVENDILDAIDYGIQQDAIFGAGMIDNHPILFTQRDGLIYVVPVASDKSRIGVGNETSLQIDVRHHGTSETQQAVSVPESKQDIGHDRSEPMLIEIEVEEEDSELSNASKSTSKDYSHRDKSSNNQSILNKSTDQSKQKAKEIAEILGESKEFEWVQQIDNRQYEAASETLSKLVEDTEILVDRKDTLIALSKLAKLAV